MHFEVIMNLKSKEEKFLEVYVLIKEFHSLVEKLKYQSRHSKCPVIENNV